MSFEIKPSSVPTSISLGSSGKYLSSTGTRTVWSTEIPTAVPPVTLTKTSLTGLTQLSDYTATTLNVFTSNKPAVIAALNTIPTGAFVTYVDAGYSSYGSFTKSGLAYDNGSNEVILPISGKEGSFYSVSDAASTPIFTYNGSVNNILTTDGTTTSWQPALSSPVLISPEERWTVSATSAGSTVNFNADTQGGLYYTAASTGNWTLNVRGSASTTLGAKLAIGDSLKISFIASNTTAYYMTTFRIDGGYQPVIWSGGTAPSAGNIPVTADGGLFEVVMFNILSSVISNVFIFCV
jgi:hypothetical protein